MHFEKLDGSEIGVYTDEAPDAMKYVSSWVAEDGDWRIEVYDENGEILKDAIAKGPYDAASDTLTVEGFFDFEDPFTVTFSYTDEGLVWTENGESTVLEYSYYTE